MLVTISRKWRGVDWLVVVMTIAVVALLVNLSALLLQKSDMPVPQPVMESFDGLGGTIDLRYGSLGASNTNNAADWIKVATFNLTSANQEIDAILEVFGSSRQTFAVKLSNNASSANTAVVMQSNKLGSGSVLFTTMAVSPSSSSGLQSSFDVYLQLAGASLSSIPVAWYLKGSGATDMVATANVPVAIAPSGSAVVLSADTSKPALPNGSVLMWNGTTPPINWGICDGTNGTPDLRGSFVLGSSANHAFGQTGGEENHTLNVNEMPNHSHSFNLPQGDQNYGNGGGNTFWGGSWGRGMGTNAVGGSAAHNNMPPYYALAYIMKLGPIAAVTTPSTTVAAATATMSTLAAPNIFQGRYVKISSGVTQCMNWGELQVYSSATGPNIASGKIVTKSSAWDANDSFPGTNLVDGNTGSFTHTSCNDVPWILVDLGSVVPIFNIRLLNRPDCCQRRAVGNVVTVLDGSGAVLFTSDKIADKNGNTIFNEASSDTLNYMQYDIFPPVSKISPSLPLTKPGQWLCVAPGQGNGTGVLPLRRSVSGGVECMTTDGKNCLWGNVNSCASNVANPPSSLQPAAMSSSWLPPNGYVCLAPGQGNGNSFLPMTYDTSKGHAYCMTTDGQNCLWSGDPQTCQNTVASPPSGIRQSNNATDAWYSITS